MLIVAVIAVVLSGCATTENNPKDPFEGFNRAMFKVNEGIDVVVKPMAQGYDAAAPLPVKAGIGNFFGNIFDVWTAVNNFLQGKGEQGLSDFGRVLVNTTIGIGGVFDVASEMGLEKHAEDFGQTLGKWGVDDGPFFFWPIIGPRTTRDTFGWFVDTYADPVWYVNDIPLRNSLVGVRYIDLRASLLPTDRIVDQAAFDKYIYIRDAYLQNRFSEINDGKTVIEGRGEVECKQSRCF
ncbi:MlaA family lipoprotein [Propionivibrio sp.]|uniref:MlaA family lipoprotein n=1 Tax=Propionivibrio sp. TaxID=2212460 RepID=UPI003BF36821